MGLLIIEGESYRGNFWIFQTCLSFLFNAIFLLHFFLDLFCYSSVKRVSFTFLLCAVGLGSGLRRL